MTNPWQEIDLNDYESHMSLDSVFQLQAMNEMMKEQFSAYPAESVMILGIAGGNGLEHISGKFKNVYGVDINQSYLAECQKRYPMLQNILKTICVDLTDADLQLPHADMLVANLLIEYIGYTNFQNVVNKVNPQFVSCGIQINESDSFVSDSPYLHVFDRLSEVHYQMEQTALIDSMAVIGYKEIAQAQKNLPNGKKLVRIDFEKQA